MKCMKRQTLKKMILGGILIVGLALQSTTALAADVNANTPAVTQTSTAPVEHNRNYVREATYYGYTVRVWVNLKTLVRKESTEFNPCNFNICKLICSCEEREKFEKYICENLMYADGFVEITISNRCGVICKYRKNIHHDPSCNPPHDDCNECHEECNEGGGWR